MLTLRTVGAGSGHRYLTEQVATGVEDFCEIDEATASGYFAGGIARGESQGRWTGRGVEGLGVSGAVRTEQLDSMLGTGAHPDAGRLYAQGLAELAARHGSVAKIPQGALRRLDSSLQLGRRYARYESAETRIAKALEDLPADATDADREHVRRAELAKGDKQAVAAYELTFQPAKSVSVLWATAGDEREKVWQAHVDAVSEAIAYLEEHAGFTRAGAGGVRQIDGNGLIVAAFEHRMSRDKDPSIHTHALVMNRVQGEDGKWRTLDGAALFQASVGARALYETALERNLNASLGVVMEPREGSPIREVVGVPRAAVDLFSKRRAAILGTAATVKPAGTRLGRRAWKRLAQRVTLATRQPKGGPESTQEAAKRWGRELRGAGLDAGQILRSAREAARQRQPQPRPDDAVAKTAEAALQLVAERRNVWSEHHLRLAIYRVAPVHPGESREAYETFVDAAQEAALTGGLVEAATPELIISGRGTTIRVSDGQSVYHRHAVTRYALRTTWAAERRLIDSLDRTGARAIGRAVVADVVAGGSLDGEQAEAVAAAVCTDRRVSVLVGPAGTGKTWTQRAVAQAWAESGGRVMALAPSQNGARVLGAEVGCRGENLAKLLYEQSRKKVHDDWVITADTLLIVDEAGMASTRELDSVIALAEKAGARVLLVGDDQQLGAVGAGGMFRTLAREANASRLSTVRRFRDADGSIRQWEADASLMLRDRDEHALDLYEQHGRIRGGTEQDMVAAAYDGWLTAALKDWKNPDAALLITDTEEQASTLCGQARAALVARGLVEQAGVTLRDGTTAGVGDRIVTRLNDRDLGAGDGFVANRDTWTVIRRDKNGDLVVRRTGAAAEDEAVLPADYVAKNVRLAYAGTVHSAQGRTVDRCHAIQSESSTAGGLYVAITRGRVSNHVFVPTVNSDDRQYHLGPDKHAVSVLAKIVGADRDQDLSVTDFAAKAREEQVQLRELVRYWTDLTEQDEVGRWRGALQRAGGAELASRVTSGDAWPTLAKQLGDLQQRGWSVDTVLSQAIGERDFADAQDPAAVVHWRLHRLTESASPPASTTDPRERPTWTRRIPGGSESTALQEIAAAMDAREQQLADRAVADHDQWRAALGPLPADPEQLAIWRDQARRVAAYRDLIGDPTSPGEADAIGPRPSAEGATRDVWEDARRAIIEARHGRTLRVMSDAGLRAMVTRAEDVESQAPVNPAAELRVVTIELRFAEVMVDDASAAAEAAQRAALAKPRLVWRRPSATGPEELEHARQQLRAAEGVVAEARSRHEALVGQAEQWRAWEGSSSETRYLGRLAAQELAVRAHRALAGRAADVGGAVTSARQLADAARVAGQSTVARNAEARRGAGWSRESAEPGAGLERE